MDHGRADRPALVVFDVAGTTMRDRGEVPAAFTETLASAGIEVRAGDVAAWRGASKREALVQLVAHHLAELSEEARAARVGDLYERFRVTLARKLERATDLSMPDAVATFERLQRQDIRVALNSGFDRSILQLILARVAWPDGLVDVVVCGEDVARGRPAPDMIFTSMERAGVRDAARVAVVGDTRLDMEAGANAGARYRIAVLTGAHDRATLEKSPATHIVPSLGAIAGVWGEGT
jgi:phosphoglycolate phosphatase